MASSTPMTTPALTLQAACKQYCALLQRMSKPPYMDRESAQAPNGAPAPALAHIWAEETLKLVEWVLQHNVFPDENVPSLDKKLDAAAELRGVLLGILEHMRRQADRRCRIVDAHTGSDIIASESEAGLQLQGIGFGILKHFAALECLTREYCVEGEEEREGGIEAEKIEALQNVGDKMVKHGESL
ncbi:hypothetical protein BJY04DRAFT_213393 [Aspergillus karnatakaensis]|uniref:uncharacterized protein n=1 Tax=Aspergillus karnatakaensis TaxID=1810916 RepID=UPI003CCD554A